MFRRSTVSPATKDMVPSRNLWRAALPRVATVPVGAATTAIRCSAPATQ